jgi:hypothetical protein
MRSRLPVGSKRGGRGRSQVKLKREGRLKPGLYQLPPDKANKNVLTYNCPLVILKKPARGGAVEARWAHNPKVVGSNPTPATKEDEANPTGFAFSFAPERSYDNIAMNNEVDGSKLDRVLGWLSLSDPFGTSLCRQKINEGRHELCHAKGHPYFILPC